MATQAEIDAMESAALEIAAGPVSVQGDEGSIRQRSVGELIELIRFLKSQGAAGSKGQSLKLSKLVPPGTVGP